MIENYKTNHFLLIKSEIELFNTNDLIVAETIAKLRLSNYILLNNYESIIQMKIQLTSLTLLKIEKDQEYLKNMEYKNLDKDYYHQLLNCINNKGVNECKGDCTDDCKGECKGECPICYENIKLYNLYKCTHRVCKQCYVNLEHHKLNDNTCPLCKSNKISNIENECQYKGIMCKHFNLLS